jgi:hypothetical protein
MFEIHSERLHGLPLVWRSLFNACGYVIPQFRRATACGFPGA